MSFFAILVALLLEQARPLAPGNLVHAGMRGWMRWVIRNLDAGREPHGWLAWAFAVLLPTAVALGIHWLLLSQFGWLAAVLWSIAVLYASLGFRQFSHHFTDIRDALEAGDEAQARQLLAEWRQTELGELSRRELVRQVIEQSVLSAHRHVFGVLAWFSILAAFGFGPAGAVFYRLAEFVARYWPHVAQQHARPVSEATRIAAAQAWHWVDWLPARITALGFAVVGSFEDAIDSWRSEEARLDASNDGVILAATAGAVNVRLGAEAPVDLEEEMSSSAPTRQEPEQAHLRSIVGLVWRSVVMWMLLLALLTLARLLG
jgi:adenosylcobinamide-phosphate synthase